jgi:hypothetical protein
MNYVIYEYLNVGYEDKLKIIKKHSRQYFSKLKNSYRVSEKKAKHIARLIGKEIEDIFLNASLLECYNKGDRVIKVNSKIIYFH